MSGKPAAPPAERSSAFEGAVLEGGAGRAPTSLADAGRIAEAEKLYAQGVALHRARKFDEAAKLYDRALKLNPHMPHGYNNLGVLLRTQRKYAAAIAVYQQGLRADADNAGLYSNLGNALKDAGRFDEAVAAHRRAVTLAPTSPESLNNLAIALKAAGRFREALDGFEQVVALKPSHVEAQWDRALLLLHHGDFARGFPAYESRWRLRDVKVPAFEQPRWDGTPFPGKTILLFGEQGFGDTIQFVRYAARVKALGGTVLVECRHGLGGLFEETAGVDRVFERGSGQPAFDLQCPLMSLPAVMGTDAATIPAEVPYLQVSAAAIAKARARLGSTGKAFRIGIVWAGSPTHKNDHNRSVALEPFLRLLEVPGTRLFSLQKGPARGQLTALGLDSVVTDLDAAIGDFTDTAAFVCALDLVVTVDSVVAHLAGALGRPAWVMVPLVPDWRWMEGIAHSPWYPSLRLFRQPGHGNWAAVVGDIVAALNQAVAPTSGI